MNDDLEKLEKELKTLKPRPLSDFTKHGIAGQLGRESGGAGEEIRHEPLVRGWGLVFLRAAAGLLIVLGGIFTFLYLSRTRQEQPVPVPTLAQVPLPADVARPNYQPVSCESTLVHQQDEGTHVLVNNGPVRRVRYHFVDNMQWHDPERGVTLTKTAPREEVVLVSLPVY